MRQTTGKRVRTILLRTMASLLVLALLTSGFFGVKGYLMYQSAVREKPVAEIAEAIRNQEGFTKYEDLPSRYIDAVIAAEDKRFETHGGIDICAIARAVWTDITTLSFAEGGSTITQQIAKNQLFTQEKRVERKFAEIFAALALEKEYSKHELFEIYVNSIYFGSGYYGIYQAAQGYFQKKPQDLTDYEAILLAGLPNAPSVYSLDNNMDLAKKRMSVVLSRMIKCGKLTLEEAEKIACD
ncbi:MAG: transglycosylase domain-containing protein [Clostridiales bacterium]|nr:transglycosylase domain-containing protein [Clostridiales bacterium]